MEPPLCVCGFAPSKELTQFPAASVTSGQRRTEDTEDTQEDRGQQQQQQLTLTQFKHEELHTFLLCLFWKTELEEEEEVAPKVSGGPRGPSRVPAGSAA